jgi:DnaJ family protein C protein 28
MNIEEQIRRAVEEGKFNDLPGKGKPLNLDENPFESPEWRLAYRALRNAGYSLPWIENRREIEEGLENARQALTRTWNWRRDNSQRERAAVVEAEWNRAVEVFRGQIAALNKRILSYNLEVPSDRFQRGLLNAEREIISITTASAESAAGEQPA